ncbi:hypothetical protein [Actibacterium sp. 188UL27-1]|uniref:hypothetical protein n=1 Tax=Actibacterium sp. 188UL27-1 TaxID=2786961 RepID=UPI0019588E5C|nr:hypothetical protein [Actibacterium sp. 188UL27-1]MBM7069311.1 hypothetical protein [Actibacterium sp. 188UL27-1]
MAVLHYRGAQLAAPNGLFCPNDRLEIEIPDNYFNGASMEPLIGLPLTRVTVIRDGQSTDMPIGSGLASFKNSLPEEEKPADMPSLALKSAPQTDNVAPFEHLHRAIGAQKMRRDQLTAQRLEDELQLEGAA